MDSTKKNHESYGILGISRQNGGDRALFGSSIKHNHVISIKIASAELDRRLNSDRVFASNTPYIEVIMSETQFAEAITSMNYGDGVPVTIKSLNGKRMEDCPYESKRELFQQEFEQQIADIEKRMDDLTKDVKTILTEKKTLNKADKEIILEHIKMLKQEVKSNIPFVNEMFAEQMDKTVKESKGEVEAFVLNKINSLGLNKLKELQGNNSKIVEIEE